MIVLPARTSSWWLAMCAECGVMPPNLSLGTTRGNCRCARVLNAVKPTGEKVGASFMDARQGSL
jgi:hypothetical protein